MITQKATEYQLQALCIIPAAAWSGGESRIYLPIMHISEDLETFLQTGKTEKAELHVFDAEYEQALTASWIQNDFRFRYYSQPMEYMHRSITIRYLQVCNPRTNLRVSLIPWFMIPGRPYPIFIYLYAIRHYYESGQKSMRLSAQAAGEVFGIDNLNKSTVCRNIEAMKQVFEHIQLDQPLQVSEPNLPSTEEMLDQLADILRHCPSAESLEESYGLKNIPLPPPVNGSKNVADALSRIPAELSDVIIEKHKDKTQDTRSRLSKNPPKRSRTQKHRPVFVESQRIRQIRAEFIVLSRAIVMNTAVKYHRLLL